MKIDIHCHATKRPLNEIEGSAYIDAIEKQMDAHGITHTVLLASYFPQKGSGISNFRLYDWVRDLPRFSMFGSLDAQHYFNQGMNELEELAVTLKMKGIKVYTGYQRIAPHQLRAIADLASAHNLPLMFHGGYTHNMDAMPLRASEIVQAIGDIPVDIIISHLSLPHIHDTIRTVNSRPRTYADMSGLFASRTEATELPIAADMTRQFLQHCGPGRLLFGTDFPVQTHAHAIEVVERATEDYAPHDKAAAKEMVYYSNARSLLWRLR